MFVAVDLHADDVDLDVDVDVDVDVDLTVVGDTIVGVDDFEALDL